MKIEVVEVSGAILHLLWILLVALAITFIVFYWRRIKDIRSTKEEGHQLLPLKEDDYRSNPFLIETIRTKCAKEENKRMRGLTILDEELFLVTGDSSEVEVYSSVAFGFKCRFHLKELIDLCNVESCNRNKCLYFMDCKDDREPREILRVDPKGKLISRWSTGDDWGRLSVTYESNVILAVYYGNKLTEYSPDGQSIREIKLSSDDGFVHPSHAIKLSDGLFVVTHGSSDDYINRVCLVDVEGKSQKSFGGERGSAIGQLNWPVYLAVDQNGSILVADWENRRILLLDSKLKFKREILDGERHGLLDPVRICLDESEGRLYVAENKYVREREILTYGRVLIFNVKARQRITKQELENLLAEEDDDEEQEIGDED